jgi:predicted transcriptional regulator
MTKKLEELFNMEDQETAENAVEEQQVPVEVTPQQIKSLDDSYAEVNKITGNLPKIQELDSMEEKDLDKLADKAEKAYDDLMDLGMNVEVRYSGRIFEVAGSMLKNAIDAKTAKVDKKLKAVDLQLKKLKIDKDSPEDSNDVLDGKGYVMLDRNELIKKLSEKE